MMTHQIPLPAMTAAADYSAKKGYACTISGTTATLCSTATGDYKIGVIVTPRDTTTLGLGLAVGEVEVYMTEAGAALAPIRNHSDGSFQLANATNDVIVGFLLQGCAANKLTRAFIHNSGVLAL